MWALQKLAGPHRDTVKAPDLVEQVCAYEAALSEIAYPEKFCSGECKCYDLSALKKRARIAFERFNPPTHDAAQVCHICGTSLNNGRSGTYCAKCDG